MIQVSKTHTEQKKLPESLVLPNPISTTKTCKCRVNPCRHTRKKRQTLQQSKNVCIQETKNNKESLVHVKNLSILPKKMSLPCIPVRMTAIATKKIPAPSTTKTMKSSAIFLPPAIGTTPVSKVNVMGCSSTMVSNSDSLHFSLKNQKSRDITSTTITVKTSNTTTVPSQSTSTPIVTMNTSNTTTVPSQSTSTPIVTMNTSNTKTVPSQSTSTPIVTMNTSNTTTVPSQSTPVPTKSMKSFPKRKLLTSGNFPITKKQKKQIVTQNHSETVLGTLIKKAVRKKQKRVTLMPKVNMKKRKGTTKPKVVRVKSKKKKLKKTTKLRKSKKKGPKRAITAYIYFCNHHRKELKKSNPQKKFSELTRDLANLWKNSTNAEKAFAVELAEKDKIRYFSEKKIFDTQELNNSESISKGKKSSVKGKTRTAKSKIPKKSKLSKIPKIPKEGTRRSSRKCSKQAKDRISKEYNLENLSNAQGIVDMTRVRDWYVANTEVQNEDVLKTKSVIKHSSDQMMKQKLSNFIRMNNIKKEKKQNNDAILSGLQAALNAVSDCGAKSTISKCNDDDIINNDLSAVSNCDAKSTISKCNDDAVLNNALNAALFAANEAVNDEQDRDNVPGSQN